MPRYSIFPRSHSALDLSPPPRRPLPASPSTPTLHLPIPQNLASSGIREISSLSFFDLPHPPPPLSDDAQRRSFKLFYPPISPRLSSHPHRRCILATPDLITAGVNGQAPLAYLCRVPYGFAGLGTVGKLPPHACRTCCCGSGLQRCNDTTVVQLLFSPSFDVFPAVTQQTRLSVMSPLCLAVADVSLCSLHASNV